MFQYIPEVNDYCILINNEGEETDKGWVYFVCPEMSDDFNKNRHSRYITLETGIREKPVCETEAQLEGKIKRNRHKYIHTLLLVYESDWKRLKYIHSRPDCKSKSYYNRFESNDTKYQQSDT